MPATIVKGSVFSSRGIVLASSSCVEQVNGLVEVQTRWFVDKARQTEIDRLFVVDAQPPSDPGCITKSSLLTQRLYMVSRSVTSENGFLSVEASYVGALARPGSRGYYLTEEKGPILRGTNFYAVPYRMFGEPFVLVDGQQPASRGYVFDYFNKEITVEYVEIDKLTATAIPELTFDDLFVFVRLIGVFGSGATMLDSLAVIFGSQVRVLPGAGGLGPRQESLASNFNKTPVRTLEPSSFLTPSVKIAKVRFTL
jgi:hypothetical protein